MQNEKILLYSPLTSLSIALFSHSQVPSATNKVVKETVHVHYDFLLCTLTGAMQQLWKSMKDESSRWKSKSASKIYGLMSPVDLVLFLMRTVNVNDS